MGRVLPDAPDEPCQLGLDLRHVGRDLVHAPGEDVEVVVAIELELGEELGHRLGDASLARGAASFVVKREPPPWYWRLLGLLQVLLILQLLAGGILLLSGRRADSFLHYLYGAVFPAIILVATHVTARRMADEADTWKAFAIAAFFVFGLTLRALTTGLGMP